MNEVGNNAVSCTAFHKTPLCCEKFLRVGRSEFMIKIAQETTSCTGSIYAHLLLDLKKVKVKFLSNLLLCTTLNVKVLPTLIKTFNFTMQTSLLLKIISQWEFAEKQKKCTTASSTGLADLHDYQESRTSGTTGISGLGGRSLTTLVARITVWSWINV